MRFLLPLLLSASVALAADPLPLWPNGAPGALGTTEFDIPTLTPFLPAPEKATGAAMVICPGGGYGGLAPHESARYAQGVAAQCIARLLLPPPPRSPK